MFILLGDGHCTNFNLWHLHFSLGTFLYKTHNLWCCMSSKLQVTYVKFWTCVKRPHILRNHFGFGPSSSLLHCMKSDFYVLYGSVKKVLCPLWPTVNGAFMFLYRKVAILNVSKDRFDQSSVYLGEMKVTPSVFLRQLKYTCSSEKFLES